MNEIPKSSTSIGFGPLVLIFIGLILCAAFALVTLGRDGLETADGQIPEQPNTQEIVSLVETPKQQNILETSDPDLRLDVVRVDPEGGAVIAGRAVSGAIISILGNGKEIGTTKANSDGSFVALMDIPVSDQPTVISLTAKRMDEGASGVAMVSHDQFLVMPQQPMVKVAPVVVAVKPKVIDDDNIQQTVEVTTVLEAPEPAIAEIENVVEPISKPATGGEAVLDEPTTVTAITLDTIDYAKDGDVVLSGRGSNDQGVRVYVDNEPVEIGRIEDGRWTLSLPDVDEGIYTVRVDAIDTVGRVTARVESPFKREIPDATDTQKDKVTIQPGFTLWQLAEETYGSGERFVQIFAANKETIKDPNLIYPGQVFKLPDQ